MDISCELQYPLQYPSIYTECFTFSREALCMHVWIVQAFPKSKEWCSSRCSDSGCGRPRMMTHADSTSTDACFRPWPLAYVMLTVHLHVTSILACSARLWRMLYASYGLNQHGHCLHLVLMVQHPPEPLGATCHRHPLTPLPPQWSMTRRLLLHLCTAVSGRSMDIYVRPILRLRPQALRRPALAA